MLTFLVRRLMLAVPVLLGVVFVVMLTVELIPGDAVALMLGEHATPEAVAKLRDYLGLDKPMVVRYVEYVGRVARGDLGRSIQQNRPVVDELGDVWPATLELTVAALVIAAVVGVLAGLVSAVWPTSWFDAVGPHRLAVRALHARVLDGPGPHRGVRLLAVLVPGGRHRRPLPPRAARGDAGAALGGHGRAHDALERAGRAPRGLRAHRAGQGRGRAARGVQARAPQRGHPHPDAARAAGRPAHGGRGADRDGVRLAGARAAHRQGDLRPRLRAGAGGGAGVRGGLRRSSISRWIWPTGCSIRASRGRARRWPSRRRARWKARRSRSSRRGGSARGASSGAIASRWRGWPSWPCSSSRPWARRGCRPSIPPSRA